MIYKYGYRLRSPGIGTQPKGFVDMIDFQGKPKGYWGTVTYNRKLTDKEMFEYDLDLLEVEDDERN